MIDCIPWKQCPTCVRTLFSWNAVYHGTHDIILWTLGHFRRPGDSQLMQTLATTILDLVAVSPATRPLKSERHPHVISQSVIPRELQRCYKLWHNLCHLSAVIHVFLKISNISSIYVCSSMSIALGAELQAEHALILQIQRCSLHNINYNSIVHDACMPDQLIMRHDIVMHNM